MNFHILLKILVKIKEKLRGHAKQSVAGARKTASRKVNQKSRSN